MKYWRINTDSEPDDGFRTCDLWYKHRMAFTGDPMGDKGKHDTVFRKLSIEDGVFMHHSRLGVVGYGVVKEEWNGKTYEGDARLLYGEREKGELYEYRISIDWDVDCDCREAPLPINDRLPHMGTYCEVNPAKYDVNSILKDLRKRASADNRRTIS